MSGFIKKIFFFVVIAFALAGLFEIACRVLRIPKISPHNIYAKSMELIPRINKNSIVILGDSRLEWGIKPLAIYDKLLDKNSRVINLAVPGSNGLDVLNYLNNHKIYPKLIIVGYTPNFGGYQNHKLDLISYSRRAIINAKVKYFLNKTFYIRDESVVEYIKHGYPYFKNHTYDDWGGAIVNEYGDYSQRTKFQIENYTLVRQSFDSLVLAKYCNTMDTLIQSFKKNGSIICGIYMPVSKKLFDIETSVLVYPVKQINYDKFYDFSKFTYEKEKPAPDSIYFLDGSHLSHEYAPVFSEKIIEYIVHDFPAVQRLKQL